MQMGGNVADRISDAEQAVMEVLWKESPLTAQDVVDRIDAGRAWSPATVRTLLGRLAGKGVIAHETDGRRYLYRPCLGRDDYVEEEARRLIDRLFGGRLTPLFAHMAERKVLTAEDITEISSIIKGMEP
jgi:BlaI family penicillinase repressor